MEGVDTVDDVVCDIGARTGGVVTNNQTHGVDWEGGLVWGRDKRRMRGIWIYSSGEVGEREMERMGGDKAAFCRIIRKRIRNSLTLQREEEKKLFLRKEGGQATGSMA